MTPEEILSTRLSEMADRYRTSLGDKALKIRQALDAAQGAESPGAELKSANLLVHRVHGTAGMYGFNEISEVAAKLEHAIEAFSNRESTWAAIETAWTEFDEAIATARRSI